LSKIQMLNLEFCLKAKFTFISLNKKNQTIKTKV